MKEKYVRRQKTPPPPGQPKRGRGRPRKTDEEKQRKAAETKVFRAAQRAAKRAALQRPGRPVGQGKGTAANTNVAGKGTGQRKTPEDEVGHYGLVLASTKGLDLFKRIGSNPLGQCVIRQRLDLLSSVRSYTQQYLPSSGKVIQTGNMEPFISTASSWPIISA
jgi:hypothetical protein